MISPFYFSVPIEYNTEFLLNTYSMLFDKKNMTYGKGSGTLTITPIENYQLKLCNILSQFIDSEIITAASFLHTQGQGYLNPHIDETRNASINIPITKTISCIQFFKCNILKVEDQKVYENGNYYIRKGAKACKDCILLENFFYYEPHCLNVSVPHGVLNNSVEERIVLSLDIDKKYTFKSFYEKYKRGEIIAS